MTVLLKSDLLVYVYGPQNRKPSSGFTVSSYTLLLPLLWASRISSRSTCLCGSRSSRGQRSLALIVLESESLELRSSPRLLPYIVTCRSPARRLSRICTVGHRRCTPHSIKASDWACLSTAAYPTPTVSSRFYTR